jgi:NADPH-dependent curcumin reductase CurA
MTTNLTVRVRTRAAGIPSPDNFTLTEEPPPICPPGGVLVRVLLATVDPGMRGWLSAEKNYLTVPDGAVMRAHGIGEVIASESPQWRVGDTAFGWLGWQQFAAIPPQDLLWKIDPAKAPLPEWLSLFGLNGLTAWLGFEHFGRPVAGQTVLVSTAAGAVGSVVGQLAAAAALRAIGLTSGPEKVALATTEFGYHTAIDYRAAGTALREKIAAACPNGIDIFFDNTAGAIADAVFPTLNTAARVIQCGTASVESWLPVPQGPRRERDMLVKRLSWHGFVAFDHTDLFPRAQDRLQTLYAAGQLTARHEILEGLHHAPGAIRHLYSGHNTGRLCIRP